MYEFGATEIEAAVKVLSSGTLFRYLPDASEVDSFEARFAAALGSRYGLLTASGTAALICALSAAGVGPGDEVLVPAYGFVADALAPLAVGAVPVVCEIDESLTMDPADLANKITPRSRAVLAIHMNGFAADLDPIGAIAARHDLVVIEDACQGLGGTYRGRPVGTIGAAGAFSFNQHKIITAGEGGALLTNEKSLYERAFMCHDGSCQYSRHEFDQPVHAGLAFRASELTAAILHAQLDRLDGIVARLRGIRDRLGAALGSIDALRPIPVADLDGACGSHLGYTFGDPATAERFLNLVDDTIGDDGVDAFRGIGYGHAFVEWDLLHQRRGGPHPRRNPLADTEWDQHRDACPRSLDILDRTVLLRYRLEISDPVIDRLRHAVARELG